MDAEQQPGMTASELGHHIRLHVSVNLEGKTLGGIFCGAEQGGGDRESLSASAPWAIP